MGAVIGMLVLHQDTWNWDDGTLWLGMFPTGLAYHAVFSLAAAGLWFTAMHVAWPAELETWADSAIIED